MQKHMMMVRSRSIVGCISADWAKPISGVFFLVLFANLIIPLRSNAASKGKFEHKQLTSSLASDSRVKEEDFFYDSMKFGVQTEKTIVKKDFKPAIGGPGQPEMASFQSVNNSNMVDLFTGDFSYNIPLMDVGGYPLSIHYTGGITMDQEASWVGLGWNINPGSISRSMRGVPDDFNGLDTITKSQSMRPNETYGATFFASTEILGKRLPLKIGRGAGIGIFKNTYNGWGLTQSINPSIDWSTSNKTQQNSGSTIGAGLSIGNNSQTGLTVSPSLHVRMNNMRNEVEGFTTMGLSTGFNSRSGLQALAFSATGSVDKNKFKSEGVGPTSVTSSGALTFARPAMTPSIMMPITNESYMVNVTFGAEAIVVHPNMRIEGYVSRQLIKKSDQIQKLPAYGYMNFQNAARKDKALLDMNREKDGQFAFAQTPAIAIPQYTYDIYSISGEGTGGTIRPYRGDIGYVRDPSVFTSNQNTNLGLEFGAGNLIHGGASIDRMQASTKVGGWTADNDAIGKLQFGEADSNYQNVYFRNPGERTSNTKTYYNQVAWDTLMRIGLQQMTSSKSRVKASNTLVKYGGLNTFKTSTLESAPLKKERDKRSQVVSWLNAGDATIFGLDKVIQSYPENIIQDPACLQTQKIGRSGGIRKSHHLSQATVLNTDGKRYIYGLPVYNAEQYDVSFSVSKVTNSSDLDKGLAPVLRGIDDSVGENKNGKEWYYSSESIPAYAHSFLLTGILSPDYVDITDNGISEDDPGDAIKFNYTRVYGSNNGYFSWRTPGMRNKASYNEGLKTYDRDDKASYFFGKKEVWYTHSVESKTMIGFFHISSNRPDALSALDIAGGYDTQKQLRRLDSISLYSKSDLIKFGSAAKPIKTVHFEYSFDLCKGLDPDRPTQGKLTLEKIWFSYYNNKKEINNGYVFNYSSQNPNYHPRHSDRWGNYKPQSGNPGLLTNAEYPYAIQDSATAANNANAWQLSEIKLPSHGRIKITYESDDYAYVQNRQAMSMMSIAGFGKLPTSSPANILYDQTDGFDYVFINTTTTIKDDKDVYRKYLQGMEFLYLKIAVKVPKDNFGSGFESIPIYAKIAGYKRVSDTRFWIRLEKIGDNSAITRSVFQFLRTSLPSKAFPGSETEAVPNLLDAVKMLTSSLREMTNSLFGFTEMSMKKGWCKQVELSKSFVRLNVPLGSKLGGGYRVKKIEIFDNWQTMTGTQKESVYGQEYQYKTSIKENNEVKYISSGVAAYEPMIGNEENPFRQPVPYQYKVAPMAPVDNMFLEMPMGESYFPAAMVGYSKVRVRTIHTKAKSANGWQESEFYTTKDFPTRVTHTPLDDDAQKRYNPRFFNILKVYAVDRVTVSQGFLVELNDMNGKPKASAIYAESDSINPVSYTKNFYRTKWTNGLRTLDNKVWVVDSSNGIVDTAGVVGLDIEVMTDFRQVLSTSGTAGINLNYDGFATPFGYINIPALWKLPNYDESLFRSVAMVKVVQRYGIVDSIEVMQKGSIVSTRNLAFDGVTGEAILTRTKNNFNDPVFSFTYPAHWAYSGMGAASSNVDFTLKGMRFIEGKLFYQGGEEYPAAKYFESGDELMVRSFENVGKISANGSCPVYQLALPVNLKWRKIWAIDLKKTGSGSGIFFIDENGKAFTAIGASIRILRSGKRNILGASVGSLSSMNNPVTFANGHYFINISNSSRIIQASSNSFSDYWKVENSLYQKDSCYQKRDTVNLIGMTPISSMMMRQYQTNRGIQAVTPSPNVILAAHLTASIQSFSNRSYKTKSIVKFNLDTIPLNATLLSSSLTLDSYEAKGIWHNNDKDKLSWQTYTKAHYVSGTNLSGRTNAAVLKNVSTKWNINTQFNLLGIGNATVNVPATTNSSCDNRTVNVLPLIQEAYTNVNLRNGFVFQLSNYSFPNNATELRAMTFNSGWGNTFQDPHFGNDTCHFGKLPSLNISYWYMKDTCVKLCQVNINDTMTNPYRWGILGNWRADRAYTYFSTREATSYGQNGTDIRRQGFIENFSPYWIFSNTVLTSAIDTNRWVWNAAQSRFNSRGFEVENYDALGRYNAGQYGYRQTMAVSVAQNARAREVWTDGLEDYLFSNTNCINCPKTREVDLVTGMNGVSLDSLEAHSGKFSLKINSGAQSVVVLPITAVGLDSMPPTIIAQVDSVPIFTGEYTVSGRGNGLQGTFSGLYTLNGRDIGWDGSGINQNIDLTGTNFSEWILPYSSGSSIPSTQPRKLTILPPDERFISNVNGWAQTTMDIYGSTKTIDSTTEQELYNAERFGNFEYTIPIGNGDYTVVFKFCELFHNLTNKRVFSVDINGTRVLSSLDILSKVPKFTAYNRSFPVTVSNGELKIKFSATVDNATFSAIDIISRSGNTQSNVPASNFTFKNFDAVWTGFIQPSYTDDYTFFLRGSGASSVRINNVDLLNNVLEGEDFASAPITLQAGQLYPITVTYTSGMDYTGSIVMSWAGKNFQAYETVPPRVLYTSSALASGSLVPKIAGYCRSLRKIRTSNMITPKLSPISGKTYVVSVWVKTEGTDGNVVTTDAGAATLQFNTDATPLSFTRTGVKIEGWQRMEAMVTAPSNATSLTLKLKAPGSAKMFFDDLRIQPYNSALKSFVYDHVSLKLMAELDENNYATFYEYDDDGTLIRVKKETEKGVQTVKETRSALIKN